MHHHTDNKLRRGQPDPVGKKVATGLGCFSIALGVLELAAARTLTRALGMRGREPLVQLFGLREIGTGIGILASKDPTPCIWARVAGDALDLGTLSPHFTDANPKRRNVAIALLSVACVTALDIYCARKLRSRPRLKQSLRHDYSNRSGFPRSPEEMRGAARDFAVPRDMRTPEPLQPFAQAAEELVHH